MTCTLGISLKRINYCLGALAERGLVKIESLSRSNNRLDCAYLLTLKGFEQKTRLIARFLERKEAEYETLQAEIEELRAETGAAKAPMSSPE